MSLSTSVFSQNETPLEHQNENGISYISGGIGQEEIDAINAASKNYNLQLTFAEKNEGGFLSDVKVQIQDARGRTVLQTVSDGPKLLVKLPQGKYKVDAELANKKISRLANLNTRSSVKLNYYWSESETDTQ
jgi:hypothetical protein